MPLKDPTKRAEYRKNYTKINSQRKAEYDKAYRKKNKQKRIKQASEWSERNPYKRDKIMKKWLSGNKEYRRSHVLKSQYGITLDTYNKLFNNQSGCCAICDKHQSQLKRRLHVDHDHLTGIVRELICQHCNTAIGLLGDSAHNVGNALQYILRHRVIQKPEWQINLAKRN
jgi:hypothetical protein